METIEKCCVRGYQVYKNIWDASIGEELACQREPSNGVDCYAVAAKFWTVKFSTFIATDELYEILPLSKNTRYTVYYYLDVQKLSGWVFVWKRNVPTNTIHLLLMNVCTIMYMYVYIGIHTCRWMELKIMMPQFN